MGETRKLAAILVADVVGYSRLAAADEDRTLVRLRGLRSDLIDPAIAAHLGRVVKRTGDGIIIEFRSVVDAVRCAIEVQNGMVERNAGLLPERRIEFRIGIHLGDVVEESGRRRLDGRGVNMRAWRGSRPTRSISPSTPIGRWPIWRLTITARPSSRTSPSRSGSIRSTSASPRGRSLRRSRRLKNPPRRASRSSSCRSPISAAAPSRSLLSTELQKA